MSRAMVNGLDRLCELPKAGKLCVCGRIGLVPSQSPKQGFNDFVKTHSEYDRNQ